MYPRNPASAFLYILCTAVCAAAAGCAAPAEPQEAVRQWVRDAQRAVEERERGTLTDMIGDSYADARGNDKTDIERMLRAWSLRGGDIVLVAKIDDVTVIGDSAATVLLTAGMAETSGGFFGFDADAMRFELELEATGDEWMLIGARWGKPGADLR